MELLKRKTPQPEDSVGRYLEVATRATVVVVTVDGQSIRGVLTDVFDDCLVLRCAVHMAPTATTAIDGECAIPHARVAWIQRPLEED